MGRKRKNVDFGKIVKNKKLPILTIDNRWHELFVEEYKTPEIKDLENKINNLLKQQGKMVHDIKDMKKLKSNLLNDIVDNMDIGEDAVGKAKGKRLDKNKQYINELNVKIDLAMDELADIPYRIKELNEELLIQSFECFYEHLEDNILELQEVAEWIAKIRDELKVKILLKQDLETKNSKIYSYMHDILGGELMELFDKENNKQ